MPEQAQITVMHLHLGYQPFAEEIGLIFRQIHIVRVTQRAVHDSQRMQGERSQFIRRRVDPLYGTGGLKTETCLVSEAHREIIGVTCGDQLTHEADRAAQEMTSVESRFDGRELSVITAVYS